MSEERARSGSPYDGTVTVAGFELKGPRIVGLFAPVVAAAAFALVHVFAFRGQAVLVGSLFLTALVMGYAYERTASLAMAAAIHGGYNAILALLAYAMIVSGLAPTEAAALVLP